VVVTRLFSYQPIYQAWASMMPWAVIDRGLIICADMKTAML